MPVEPLPTSRLRTRSDPLHFAFKTTAELADLEEVVAQDRAVEAVRFAVDVSGDGFNVFAVGPPGTGKRTLLRQVLEARAAGEDAPDDWCYVNDFSEPYRPHALRLPAGRGRQLRDRLDQLIAELRAAIPAAFESDDYRHRREALEAEMNRLRDEAAAAFEAKTRELDVGLIRTPLGPALAPLRDGKPLEPDDVAKLPDAEKERLRKAAESLQSELDDLVAQVPRWAREHRRGLQRLNEEVTRSAVRHLIEEVRDDYRDLPDALAFLEAVEKDLVAHAGESLRAAEQAVSSAAQASGAGLVPGGEDPFRRYRVNVLVARAPDGGTPVVVEDNPTYANLIGRIEHVAQLGALITDFLQIKPGALHRANGGYLVLEARKVLGEPFAWEALKRALRTRRIEIESLGQQLSLISTASLEPEPIPLDVKIALVGDRLLYQLLGALDPDLPELFKVQADFDDRTIRDGGSEMLYARLLATLARRDGLRSLDASAVARTIEHAARLAGDAERLSTHMLTLSDLIREADHWAGERGSDTVAAQDVERAIEARRRRASRLQERIHEEIGRGSILVATDGEAVGQVNGLTVAEYGGQLFGWPSRITARVRLGRGEVVDIEREVALGGPIHSKGVLILAGFLGGRYARETPLSLQASLVFEQSYGGVEGDSASLGELCALLSAVGQVPIRQALAVSGSVNQLGAVQPVGAINEKIEGFFEVCRRRGVLRDQDETVQGVIIPAANVKDLMLHDDVIEAADQGTFRIYPVETVDEALQLLTGRSSGTADASGRFPDGTVNGAVQAVLAAMATRAREFGSLAAAEGPGVRNP